MLSLAPTVEYGGQGEGRWTVLGYLGGLKPMKEEETKLAPVTLHTRTQLKREEAHSTCPQGERK